MEKRGATATTTAAATGCFKCGRPGHWSRDCPSSATSGSNHNRTTTAAAASSSSIPPRSQPPPTKLAAKKVPRSRPKLTPDLLLSDDGLGYVLRHFPRSFKYHGRGHEVSDLGNFISLYAEWHSKLLPYYSFDQFVQKVEKVGATRRVRRCISELRERIARGGDPTKLHEPPVEEMLQDCEQCEDQMDKIAAEERNDADDTQELSEEMYRKATAELQQPSQSLNEAPRRTPESITNMGPDPEEGCMEEQPSDAAKTNVSWPNKVEITEEQRARMEANRLKALERAAQRARSTQVSSS